MIRKLIITAAFAAVSTFSLSAISGPDKIIPQPVDFSIADGIYNLKTDGSDIKVYLSSPSFADKVLGFFIFTDKNYVNHS